jgi:hypothetical protein
MLIEDNMGEFLKEYRQGLIKRFPKISFGDDEVWEFFMSQMDLSYEIGVQQERADCLDILEEMAKKDKLTNYYKVAISAIKEKSKYEP